MQILYKSTVICFVLAISACASDPVSQVTLPTPEPISGDLMIRESQGIASLGDRWKKGKDMVDKGNRLVSQGQAKVNEGNKMIEEGQTIIHESEATYKNIKK